MKEGPSEQLEKSKLPRIITTIIAGISAFVLNCAKADMSKSTTPEVKTPAPKVLPKPKTAQRITSFCGPGKEVDEFIKNTCIKGTVEKYRDESRLLCARCMKEIEIWE